MKKTVLGLAVCILISTFLALPSYAESYSANSIKNTASATESQTLYYEEGAIKIYVGDLIEIEDEKEARPAYFTRRFDLPFTVYYGTIHIATLTAHLTTVGLSRDWCFADSGSYTYETHVGLVNVYFWEPNTFTSTFIQAAFKIQYINNIIGPQAIRFYADPENGNVTW